MEERDNNLKFSQEEAEFTAEDFQFVQLDKSIHEQRFQGKASSYGRDSVRRFAKNKTSVFGFCLFGLILLLSAIFSFALPGNADRTRPTIVEGKLPPKLFKAGTGFWDGTRVYRNQIYDAENETAILPSTLTPEGYMGIEGDPYPGFYANETEKGSGGYVQVLAGSYLATPSLEVDLTLADSGAMNFQYGIQLEITDYIANDESIVFDPQETSFSIYLQPLNIDGSSWGSPLSLVSGLSIDQSGTPIDLTSYLTEVEFPVNEDGAVMLPTRETLEHARLVVQNDTGNLFVKAASLTSTYKDYSEYNFTDANAAMYQTRQLESGDINSRSVWWTRSSSSSVHAVHVAVTLCDFRYDPYIVVYGIKKTTQIPSSTLMNMREEGIVTFETYQVTDFLTGEKVEVMVDGTLVMLDQDASLIVDPNLTDEEGNILYPMEVVVSTGIAGTTWSVNAYIYGYKDLGYSRMPVHLMGTDDNGLDMAKTVSIGLLYSLGIGIAISVLCFAFGLAWGSFSGYHGGWVDLGMERVVDILSYIPSTVIITLLMLNLGRSWYVFLIAMCLTGWIGTSSITRTQFYRFKRREYVLAARSLGAKDSRLIWRHILPNGLGTIITSSVLMIPSVIYSEASLAYLGLGFQDINSMGTILQTNQSYISTVTMTENLTYLILFPSVVLALLLICFELFGQGLRDAVDPNTKGAESF